MRILYLVDIRFPMERANGIQTMETAHALATLGHDVTLGVRPDIQTPPRDPCAFYGLPASPHLHVIRAPVAGAYALRRIHYLAWAALQAARRRADVVFTRDLGVAAALLRLPQSRRPPIVYESHGYAPAFAATVDELVTGAAPATPSKLERLERRERRVWRRAAGYIATTQANIDDLVERFGPRSNVAVISNGVRLVEPRVVPAPPPPGPPVVGYAGHLYRWKGPDTFLQALARLDTVRGLIVGGHPQERDWGRVQALVTELGLDGRVEITGLVPSGEVASRLLGASVLVVPTTATRSARYTSPLKLFEYMALGRPIVATDLPSIREVARHESNALVVPPDDPAAMAAAIARLTHDAALASRLARQAWEDVAAHSWRRRAERVADVLTLSLH